MLTDEESVLLTGVQPPDYRLRTLVFFWLPLFATWMMMSVEGPLLSALIARLPEAKLNLAAYGVAFAIALLVESPIIMMASAATELVRGRSSYLRLRHFGLALNALVTGLLLFLLIPPVFRVFTLELLGLPPAVAALTREACFWLLPWPGAIGYRRFYQGILIRNRQTRRVALSTVCRLFAMSSTAFLLFSYTSMNGVAVGAASLSAGVTIEAFIVRLMVRGAIRQLLAGDSGERELTYSYILNFYYPLALTSMIGLALHPVITFFMGKSRMPLESLAILPVLNALVFIFRSVGLSYMEVTIAFMSREGDWYPLLRRLALILMGVVGTILLLISYTPLADGWFRQVAGLSPELAIFAGLPLQIQAFIPMLSILLSFQRGVLVNAHFTGSITLATALEVGMVGLLLGICIIGLDIVGALAASISMLIGRLAANLYLALPFRRARLLAGRSGYLRDRE